MEVIILPQGRKVPFNKIREYSGRFHFIKQLITKGTTSSKIIYQTGISEFKDYIHESNDTNFCYFQLLRKGLILRLKQKERQLVALLSGKEIRKVVLDSFKVNKENKIQLSGNLKIETGDKTMRFFVPVNSFNNIFDFFHRSFLKELIQYNQDDRPPLNDDDIALLKVLNQFGKKK